MVRTTTRSQRQPSQSQLRQTRGGQSQRVRRGHAVEDEDGEEDHGQDEEDIDENAEGDNMDDGGDVQNELERKANDLVRLALFTEQRRVPLKRDEISKKVLGTNRRALNIVLSRAQEILRKTFGMELVELQSRAERDMDDNDKDAELLLNTGMKKRAAPSGTKSYILRSVLHPIIIEQAVAANADILAVEQADLANGNDDNDDDDGAGTSSNGSILAWHTADQLGSIGILYVILALILVDGRVVSDNDLRALLKRLRLPSGANVPQNGRSTNQSMTIDTYLTQLVRQGYLDRHHVGEAKGAGGKRGRAPAASQAPTADDGASSWEWRWGPRAMSEVGEKSIAQFVAEFMVERAMGQNDEDEDGERGARRREEDATKKKFESIMRGIERAAAGAALSDIR
ncbi:hypothetical protein AcW1_002900 [Taiwanofungus camphoratus]|nr:hypothetical protein AcW1_002900 [Antrodia cinnamomea]